MGVLEDLTEQSAERAQLEGSRLLSTKFVRSWRIKCGGFQMTRRSSSILEGPGSSA